MSAAVSGDRLVLSIAISADKGHFPAVKGKTGETACTGSDKIFDRFSAKCELLGVRGNMGNIL